MQDEKYTILAPQMLPIHFGILEPVCRKHGYNLVILDNDNRKAIDTGLKYVNNDACFPSITVVGQFMEAVTSGRYDTDRLAILMTQTGGCCRASNYVSFIRRALDKAGYSHYGTSYKGVIGSALAMKTIKAIRKPAVKALERSKRFDIPISIDDIAAMAKPILSLGNRYGEGWLLTGEMVELITHGTPNIVCIQPFACLPNHVVGKGVIKKLHEMYPESNIVAVDYDPGASEVNQLNRIKLMLSAAKERM